MIVSFFIYFVGSVEDEWEKMWKLKVGQSFAISSLSCNSFFFSWLNIFLDFFSLVTLSQEFFQCDQLNIIQKKEIINSFYFLHYWLRLCFLLHLKMAWTWFNLFRIKEISFMSSFLVIFMLVLPEIFLLCAMRVRFFLCSF